MNFLIDYGLQRGDFLDRFSPEYSRMPWLAQYPGQQLYYIRVDGKDGDIIKVTWDNRGQKFSWLCNIYMRIRAWNRLK